LAVNLLEQKKMQKAPGGGTTSPTGGAGRETVPKTGGTGAGTEPPEKSAAPKRFRRTATLDPKRVGRDAGRNADEVVLHLAGIVGANVKVTNCRTLKFDCQGFETE